jgi:hypothetical protein
MKARLLPFPSVLALVLLSGNANRGGTALPPRAEDWFKWGDYDSLISVLEPWAKDTAEASAERARAFLYLGVAYQAGNERRLSDSAFHKACDLDTAVGLDQYYVAPEILDHFHAVAAECRSRNTARAPIPSRPIDAGPKPGADLAALPISAKGAKPMESRPAAQKERSSHALLWWTVGSAVTASVLVAGALILLQPERKPIDSVTVIDGR